MKKPAVLWCFVSVARLIFDRAMNTPLRSTRARCVLWRLLASTFAGRPHRRHRRGVQGVLGRAHAAGRREGRSRSLRSGVTVDEALKRLKAGRPYSANVLKGVVKAELQGARQGILLRRRSSRVLRPGRRYQVRFQLHGGVMRPSNQPRGDGTIGALAGAEQIYIIPYAWADAPWWSDDQLDNLSAILDTVKRTYNVDENRVVLAGVSDGGTGAYYFAMRDTTPFAELPAAQRQHLVLTKRGPRRGRPVPEQPAQQAVVRRQRRARSAVSRELVEPYVEHLKKKGVDVVYKPQPNGVHNTAWWPEVKDTFEAFVRNHPRKPLPDTLTWETNGAASTTAPHWLVIDKLAPKAQREPSWIVNLVTEGPMMFDNVHPSGRVDLVRTGNTVTAATIGVAEFTLLCRPMRSTGAARQGRRQRPHGIQRPGRTEPSTLLKWAARDNDRTMLFVAELHIKI